MKYVEKRLFTIGVIVISLFLVTNPLFTSAAKASPRKLRQYKRTFIPIRFKNARIYKNGLRLNSVCVSIKGVCQSLPGIVSVERTSKHTMTFVVRASTKVGLLRRWKNKGVKRTMKVIRRNKMGKVTQAINCFGCFPVKFDAGSHSTSSDIKCITITCNIERIEVA